MFLRIVSRAAAAVFISCFAVACSGGDPGDPAHVAEFKTQCKKALGSDARENCKCMTGRLTGTLRSPDEFLLAAGIVKALGRTATTQRLLNTSNSTTLDVLQISLDRLSKEFNNRVSIPRKQAVLHAVRQDVQTCVNQAARSASR